MLRARVAGLIFAAFLPLCGQEPQPVAPGSLTIEEVLRLANAGVADELIVASVKRNAKAFDLNSDEIVALTKSGVSNTVIKYLLDPTLPYTPPPAEPPPAPQGSPAASTTSKFPFDPLAEKVPSETGLYYLSGAQEFMRLDLKPILPLSEPGKFSKLTGGHVVGSVAGSAAKIRTSKDPLVFYARLGEKVAIDDLVLLSVEPDKKEKRRELDFGTKAGTPVFPTKSVHQFDSKEIGPDGLYRIAVPALSGGEYLFYILGSADNKKGLLGKGYDFGVD
jgi:hypothetical protein